MARKHLLSSVFILKLSYKSNIFFYWFTDIINHEGSGCWRKTREKFKELKFFSSQKCYIRSKFYQTLVFRKIYWADSYGDVIHRSSLDDSESSDVIKSIVDIPDGLAVDTIGRKLYWTDAGFKRIQVAELDGKYRTVLLWENLDKPRAITLNYKKG